MNEFHFIQSQLPEDRSRGWSEMHYWRRQEELTIRPFRGIHSTNHRVQPIITNLSKRHEAIGGDAGGVTSSRELTFSGRVFLYHEWPLSNKQKADVVEAYGAKGLDVQFRGLDYLADQVIAWHQEHDARTSH